MVDTCAGGENVRSINPELWQACAGPLVNLPPAGTHVVYFPQGHSEQVGGYEMDNAISVLSCQILGLFYFIL